MYEATACQSYHGLTRLKLWNAKLMRPILSFRHLHRKHDTCNSTTGRVVFTPKWMWLAWAKDPPRKCPMACPSGHTLIQANHPRGRHCHHVLVPLKDNLMNLLEVIKKGWLVTVSKATFLSYNLKLLARHALLAEIRTRIFTPIICLPEIIR